MATNRKRTPRSRRESGLSQAETDWLYSRPYPEPGQEDDERDGTNGFDYFCAYYGGGDSRTGKSLWDQHKDSILREWIAEHPCSRPQRWWDFDAPKEDLNCQHFPGARAHRRRLGGTGTPQYEVLGVGPSFELGLPCSWVDTFMEEYYNGRAVNMHGEVIPTHYKEGNFRGKAIDPADPPLFESQAAYLQRHALLTAEERRYLARNPRLLEDEALRPFSSDDG